MEERQRPRSASPREIEEASEKAHGLVNKDLGVVHEGQAWGSSEASRHNSGQNSPVKTEQHNSKDDKFDLDVYGDDGFIKVQNKKDKKEQKDQKKFKYETLECKNKNNDIYYTDVCYEELENGNVTIIGFMNRPFHREPLYDLNTYIKVNTDVEFCKITEGGKIIDFIYYYGCKNKNCPYVYPYCYMKATNYLKSAFLLAKEGVSGFNKEVYVYCGKCRPENQNFKKTEKEVIGEHLQQPTPTIEEYPLLKQQAQLQNNSSSQLKPYFNASKPWAVEHNTPSIENRIFYLTNQIKKSENIIQEEISKVDVWRKELDEIKNSEKTKRRIEIQKELEQKKKEQQELEKKLQLLL